jgi:hypothetical protein
MTLFVGLAVGAAATLLLLFAGRGRSAVLRLVTAVLAIWLCVVAVKVAHGQDCDGDGVVRINDLIIFVAIGLGEAPVGECVDNGCGGVVQIDCIVHAVELAMAAPTPTAVVGAIVGKDPLPAPMYLP